MDDQKFSIYNVKKVKEINGENLVNKYLMCGWVLLSTAMESFEGDTCPVSLMGAVSLDVPEPELKSPMHDFLKDRHKN